MKNSNCYLLILKVAKDASGWVKDETEGAEYGSDRSTKQSSSLSYSLLVERELKNTVK